MLKTILVMGLLGSSYTKRLTKPGSVFGGLSSTHISGNGVCGHFNTTQIGLDDCSLQGNRACFQIFHAG